MYIVFTRTSNSVTQCYIGLRNRKSGTTELYLIMYCKVFYARQQNASRVLAII